MRQLRKREVSQVLLEENLREGHCYFIRYSQEVHNKKTVSVGMLTSPFIRVFHLQSSSRYVILGVWLIYLCSAAYVESQRICKKIFDTGL